MEADMRTIALGVAIASFISTLAAEEVQRLPDGTAVAFSYWVKFCKSTMLKSACFVGKEARTVDGKPLVAAVVIQPNGEAEFLRLTFPITVNRVTGTRLLFDKATSGQSADFVSCKRRIGCMADYADPRTIAKMRTAHSMTLQATDGEGGSAIRLRSDRFCKSLRWA
jgi:hypothetical protein